MDVAAPIESSLPMAWECLLYFLSLSPSSSSSAELQGESSRILKDSLQSIACIFDSAVQSPRKSPAAT